MEKFTYTIFDGNPHQSGPTAWPGHSEVEIEADTPEDVLVEALAEARAEGEASGEYENGDRLWVLVWNADNSIVAEGAVTLDVEDDDEDDDDDEPEDEEDDEADYRVCDYDTGDRLDGEPSDELINESLAADPTGAVSAYQDAEGVWQYVPPSQVDFYTRQRKEEVITVYVEDD